MEVITGVFFTVTKKMGEILVLQGSHKPSFHTVRCIPTDR